MSESQKNAALIQFNDEIDKQSYNIVAGSYRFFFNKAGLGSEYPKSKLEDFYDHIIEFALCEETIAICQHCKCFFQKKVFEHNHIRGATTSVKKVLKNVKKMGCQEKKCIAEKIQQTFGSHFVLAGKFVLPPLSDNLNCSDNADLIEKYPKSNYTSLVEAYTKAHKDIKLLKKRHIEEIGNIESDQFTRQNDFKQVLKDQTDQIAKLYTDIFHLQCTIRQEEIEKWRQKASNTEIIDNLKKHLNLAYLWHTETFELYRTEDYKHYQSHRKGMSNRIQKAIEVLGNLAHLPFSLHFQRDQIQLPEELIQLEARVEFSKNIQESRE